MPKKKVEEKKVEEKKAFPAPVLADYEIVLEPVITEKSMALLQNENKVTIKVSKNANKTAIKKSFERLYQVKVVDVKIINVEAKEISRGTRFKGSTSAFKKAYVKLASGQAIDLFKE